MGDDEEFDNGSMVVGNIDNSSEASSSKLYSLHVHFIF